MVALAAKLARMIWASLRHERAYVLIPEQAARLFRDDTAHLFQLILAQHSG